MSNKFTWLGGGIIGLSILGAFLYTQFSAPSYNTISTDLSTFPVVGEKVENDFGEYPLVAFNDDFTITDTLKDGVEIAYGKETEEPVTISQGEFGSSSEETTFDSPDLAQTLSLAFPKDLRQPLTVSLPGGRVIQVTHNVQESYSRELLTTKASEASAFTEESKTGLAPLERTLQGRADAEQVLPEKLAPSYIKYSSTDSRINTYYAYQKDQAAGYRNLKHWTIFNNGTGEESQSYTFTNANLKINDRGEVEVRYVQPADETVKAQVGEDLWARAQKVLADDMAADLENRPPDLTIPAPYIIDGLGKTTVLEWEVSEDKSTLSVAFSVQKIAYPIALDPTLQFTAPGVSNTGDVITGYSANDNLGNSLTTGDFNADGKIDLAVGASGYGSYQGRAYIFYGGSINTENAATADAIISGESASNFFGGALTAGDFNSDGKTDLVVGASGYGSYQGRAYIFYNDGSIPTTAATADVIITGESAGNYFGASLTTGDLNSNGKTDLAVGANSYNTSQGRAYIFYNDGSIPTTAATADVIITGEAGSVFGAAITTGDLNADGRTDLIVGASYYSSLQGRAYIFYNDGSIPTTAATADVIITGESSSAFGTSLTTGDFNADSKTDLVVGAKIYSSNQGRAYIFYNDGSIPTTAATADVIITGESSSWFGSALTVGDFNSDGRSDLAVGASKFTTDTGRSYIFYNDGSIPTTAATADVIITGEATYNKFGDALTAGDFNSDGRIDLAVGANSYNTSQGRAYIFYSQSGQVNLNTNITGEATSNSFGSAFAVGDFNSDGRMDLAVGAYGYSSNTGRAYIFYNDGSIPTTAATADVIITGETSSNFGVSLTAGDFNADGKIDLAIGAYGYNTFQGRAYIFYNDGSIPTTAATADVIITGEGIVNLFGGSLTAGDINADGRTDLAVGANGYSTNTGRAYIFYNDGSIPTTAATADVIITGEATNNYFGAALSAGDFNADGRTDLAVGAQGYSSNTGRAYIFYNDGSIPTTAATADVIITGEATSNSFGSALTAGDFNADGRKDLVVSAIGYNSSQGRAYIFYNDGSIPTTAATADVIITGESTTNNFGRSLTAGDFNADGRMDLAVGAPSYNSSQGRAYIFYNDGSIPTTAGTADVVTTGEANSSFGWALTAADFNADGRTDLVVGATGYNSSQGRLYFYETREDYSWKIQRQSLKDGLRVDPIMGYELKVTGETTGNSFGSSMTVADLNNDGKSDLIVGARGFDSGRGRVYIFYNDGDYVTKAGRADVIITGEANSFFGGSLTTGDFNADGKTDLVVGARGYVTLTGRAYIFYNDGSIPTTAATADVIITGEGTINTFGGAFTAGDFNADGKVDLAVGASAYNASQGRAYIFYNDGSIPTTAATADVIITGQSINDIFGHSLTAGDFNADGKTDLVVSAKGFSGKTYIFYNDGSIPTTAATADVIITGESSSNLGSALTAGDFNADGKTDLAVGASAYNSLQGRAYIFYNDGSIPTTAATADVIITGEAIGNYFGESLTAGDLNSDGRTDLAVGAPGYNSSQGRAYIFYNDGSIPTTAATADVIITGESTTNNFGTALTAGDFNADGKTDLLVGATDYNSSQGRVYIYTTNDVNMAGETTNNTFGSSFAVGDFNNDGKNDLAVGAPGYNSNQGRAYIFYGGALKNEIASGADVTMTGETTSNQFGISLTTGDLNADGKTDLAVGANTYSSSKGRVYVFYGGSIITENASGADVILTGVTNGDHVGIAVSVGDYNNDGKDDLATGAHRTASFDGKVYIFYGGTMISETTAGADITLTGETSSYFGYSLITDDFNADGKDDLVVGAYRYSTFNQGRVYVFYGGSIITENASGADVILSKIDAYNYFGYTLTSGDYNNDGKEDLAVGTFNLYGEVYIFYGGSMISETTAGADVVLSSQIFGNYFGTALTTGDFNADGKDDLAVGAFGNTTNTGRVYIFNGGSIGTKDAELANVIITGKQTNSSFGIAILGADLSGNGVDDLIVGATQTNSSTGKVFVIMSEASAFHVASYRFRGNMQLRGNIQFR